jgi:hypothetical protein
MRCFNGSSVPGSLVLILRSFFLSDRVLKCLQKKTPRSCWNAGLAFVVPVIVRYPLFLLPRSSTSFTRRTPLKRIERSKVEDVSAFMTFDHVG